MRDLIIATTNMGKFAEIKAQLAGQFGRLYSLLDFSDRNSVAEDQGSYAENALKKARKIGDQFGIGTLADDSGLEVDALQGRPGIYSARYGQNDTDRIGRLLLEMQGIADGQRGAIFKAYLAVYMPEEDRGYLFYGSVRGSIGHKPCGQHGFGFDPVFYVPEVGKYMAELTLEEKNRVSHRGRALAAFKHFLKMGLPTAAA